MAIKKSENPPGTGKTGDDIRSRIIDALMKLAEQRNWDDISLLDVAGEAGITLADLRQHFHSKGAILAGLARKIDIIVLEQSFTGLAEEPPKERLLDVLLRRLDAMKAYRAGLRNIMQTACFDPFASFSLNQVLNNSMRFMLEAADLTKNDPFQGLKTQALAVAWLRILAIWVKDEDPDITRTMAALDKELTRGENALHKLESVSRLMSPFKTIMHSVCDARKDLHFKTRERGTAGEAFDASI